MSTKSLKLENQNPIAARTTKAAIKRRACDHRSAFGLCPSFGLQALLVLMVGTQLSSGDGFEGRITATLTRGSEVQTWLYTVGTNHLRLERGETNRPYAQNLVELDTGQITLVFPHNRSFVRLESTPAGSKTAGASGVRPPGFPPATGLPVSPPPSVTPGAAIGGLPATPPAIGPANLPGTPAPPAMPQLPPGVGPQAGVGSGNLPALPMMPLPPMEPVELITTTNTTNLLGYACTRYDLKQHGEVMEIWATAQLPPFQPWLANQPPRFGPRMVAEQWGTWLRERKLFPLLAISRYENGPEHLRFEVKSITPERMQEQDRPRFAPPPGYHELEPLPF